MDEIEQILEHLEQLVPLLVGKRLDKVYILEVVSCQFRIAGSDHNEWDVVGNFPEQVSAAWVDEHNCVEVNRSSRSKVVNK